MSITWILCLLSLPTLAAPNLKLLLQEGQAETMTSAHRSMAWATRFSASFKLRSLS